MPRLICRAEELVDGGDAIRFEIETASGPRAAFAQRWRGVVRAYLNRCEHVPVELDWNPGKILDDSGEWLLCATHGALYAPDTGVCAAGPCAGRRLQTLRVTEQNHNIYLHEEESPQDE